jgi:hypothetical protein
MIAQGLLPFKYEIEKKATGMTSMGGMPLYLDLMEAIRLRSVTDKHIHIHTHGQGWTDTEMITALILLNISGGESVSDLRILEGDEGMKKILQHIATYGMSTRERRAYMRRFRIEKNRVFPSSNAIFDWLEQFHSDEEEKKREAHTSFIPKPNDHLKGLGRINTELINTYTSKNPKQEATLDIDSVFVETYKDDATYCYKKYKAYQGVNIYWAEEDLVLASEFRDGNVKPGYDQLRIFKEALETLPDHVTKVSHRSDSAGYQKDILTYCAEGKNERFGVIEFAVSSSVTDAFKEAVRELKDDEWNRLYLQEEDGSKIATNEEWAEVCYVPTWVGYKKHGPQYRYIALREPIRELELPGFERPVEQLPFPVITMKGNQRYKLFGIVTNRTIPGDEVIWWLRKRCGKSEEKHSEMKKGFAGGRLPSGKFGVNASWWGIMILSLNIHTMLKRLALPEKWHTRQMKAIRFHLINLAGRVIEHARTVIIKLLADHPSSELLIRARCALREFAYGPSG